MTPEEVRKYRLRNLNIPRVDLVDRGANQHAHIMIAKADVEKRTPQIRRALKALDAKKEANKRKKEGKRPLGSEDNSLPFAGKNGNGEGNGKPSPNGMPPASKTVANGNGKPPPEEDPKKKKKKKPAPFAKIDTMNDLREAISAAGLVPPPSVRQHITRRAVDLGATSSVPFPWLSRSAPDARSNIPIRGDNHE